MHRVTTLDMSLSCEAQPEQFSNDFYKNAMLNCDTLLIKKKRKQKKTTTEQHLFRDNLLSFK